MQHPNGRRRALGALAATAICPGLALAQASYPDRPIKYLVPYTAGGGADFIARVVAEGLTKHLGQPVIVENRPGASGVIATQLGANAAPDGYTILLAGVDALAFNTAMFDKLPYDPQKDFTYVSLQAKLDMMVVVREESPYKTLAELIAAIQAKPGVVSFASPGKGTPHYLGMELFLKENKLRALGIQYQGVAPAVRDILAGIIDFGFIDLAATLPQVKANKVRVLGVAAKTRIAALPNVPTLGELGYPFISYVWNGIVMPAGVPKPVLDRFIRAMRETMRDETLRATFAASGIEPMFTTPEEYRNLTLAEIKRWGPSIRELGIKL